MQHHKLMWIVQELDIDSEFTLGVCHTEEDAKKLAKILEEEQDKKEDGEYKYSYYVTSVRVYNPEEIE